MIIFGYSGKYYNLYPSGLMHIPHNLRMGYQVVVNPVPATIKIYRKNTGMRCVFTESLV